MQHTVEYQTFGVRIDEVINKDLARNPDWRLVSATSLQVSRIDKPDIHVFVVFENSSPVAQWRNSNG